MRKLFTCAEAMQGGLTRSAIRWGEQNGSWRRVGRGVYGEGPDDPTPLDRALGTVIATGGIACGRLAGVMHGLDGLELDGPEIISVQSTHSTRRPGVRRRRLDEERVVQINGIRCTDGPQTMLDLAPCLDDPAWEQALESALRKRLLTVGELEVGRPRSQGAARIERVLALRGPNAAPTESLLETLMVQLARGVEGLPSPVRQLTVNDNHDQFVARLDLAWPDIGLFVELDGQHHAGQPVYDARRETAVVAVTGWLCGRFTWTEVVRFPKSTARRLAALADQARRRPWKGEIAALSG